MIVGCPKEIKNNENRVGLSPVGVDSLKRAGHEVIVQKGAGLGSGITDEEYVAAGATMIADAKEVWAKSDMIIKVKEPLDYEPDVLHEGQILYTYLHLAPLPELTDKLLKSKAVCVAYETVQEADRSLPLLAPMSEIAGRLATQIGAHFLEKRQGGRGVLLGGVTGTEKGKVLVIGAGVVGTESAKVAVGMGAEVTVVDINIKRLAYLRDIFGNSLKTIYSTPKAIAEAAKEADLVIGAVLIPGAKAPKLLTEEMVKGMLPGSVIVDVAIDQGGCIETSETTSHDTPVKEKHGVLHYGVPNMPGAVARTSTYALTNATLRYMLDIANKGIDQAVRENEALKKGVNVYKGKITYKAVADDQGKEYVDIDTLL
ncbi:MAG: alanine dehydrogenase [Candidatus Gracilibacteria bacterium]|nr:alanine dehydrogenase [Candidatus Gracilibacteria bacterium]